jgi:hypothetical protein
MLVFKNNRVVIFGLLIFLVVVVVLWNQREHLSVNKDNSKNWDKPELSSVPERTPEGEDIVSIKNRLAAVESAVADLKSKVSK